MPSSSSHRRIAYQSIKQTAEAYPNLSGSNILNMARARAFMAHNKSAQFNTFYTSAVNYVKKLNKNKKMQNKLLSAIVHNMGNSKKRSTEYLIF